MFQTKPQLAALLIRSQAPTAAGLATVLLHGVCHVARRDAALPHGLHLGSNLNPPRESATKGLLQIEPHRTVAKMPTELCEDGI